MPPRKRTRAKADGECKIGDCTKPGANRGLCDGHWMTRRGDADPKTENLKG